MEKYQYIHLKKKNKSFFKHFILLIKDKTKFSLSLVTITIHDTASFNFFLLRLLRIYRQEQKLSNKFMKSQPLHFARFYTRSKFNLQI